MAVGSSPVTVTYCLIVFAVLYGCKRYLIHISPFQNVGSLPMKSSYIKNGFLDKPIFKDFTCSLRMLHISKIRSNDGSFQEFFQTVMSTVFL